MFKKIMSLIAIFIAMIIFALVAFAERNVDVDTSDAANGTIKVLYENPDVTKAKLLIQKDSEKYYYNLKNTDDYEEFSLQMGDGTYTIAIYENVYSTKYRKVFEDTVDVALKADTNVYTKSVQNVKFDTSSQAIKVANKLTKNAITDEEKVQAIYKYIVMNITYDNNKIKNITSNYVPDIDQTLNDGTGICYDYASLFAAMCRSQGISTKLMKGYSTVTTAYHAWNEVYLNGNWIIVDTTYDAYMYGHDRSYTFEKDSKYYTADREY